MKKLFSGGAVLFFVSTFLPTLAQAHDLPGDPAGVHHVPFGWMAAVATGAFLFLARRAARSL